MLVPDSVTVCVLFHLIKYRQSHQRQTGGGEIPEMTETDHMEKETSVQVAETVPTDQTITPTPCEMVKLPRKRFFRQRAHCNPFSDHDLT